MGTALGAILLATALANCNMRTPPKQAQSSACPPPGTQVPLSQLWAQSPTFAGCDVSTEVTFGMVAQQRGTGGCDPWGSLIPVPAGDQCFYVGAPNELDGKPNTSYVLQVGKEHSGPLFGTAGGTLLRVRGTLARWEGTSFPYKTFKAVSVEPVNTAPASTETPDGGSPPEVPTPTTPTPAASSEPTP